MNSGYYGDYGNYNTRYEISDTVGYLRLVSNISAFLGIFSLIIGISVSILMTISMWKIFKKAGHEGWKSLIPIYNMYIMCQIAGKEWWYLLFFLVPFANIYAMFVIYDGIAKRFGKTTGFTIGMMILPVIFLPILAFSKNDSFVNKEVNVGNSNSYLSSESQNISTEENMSDVSEVIMNDDSSLTYDAPTFENDNIQMNDFSSVNNMNSVNSMQIDNLNTMPNFNQIPNNNVQMNDFSSANNMNSANNMQTNNLNTMPNFNQMPNNNQVNNLNPINNMENINSDIDQNSNLN